MRGHGIESCIGQEENEKQQKKEKKDHHLQSIEQPSVTPLST